MGGLILLFPIDKASCC